MRVCTFKNMWQEVYFDFWHWILRVRLIINGFTFQELKLWSAHLRNASRFYYWESSDKKEHQYADCSIVAPTHCITYIRDALVKHSTSLWQSVTNHSFVYLLCCRHCRNSDSAAPLLIVLPVSTLTSAVCRPWRISVLIAPHTCIIACTVVYYNLLDNLITSFVWRQTSSGHLSFNGRWKLVCCIVIYWDGP